MGKGEETRHQIVSSALALASEVGLSGLSIGGLAERVGMSKSGLFAHFTSKENLQIAVLDAAVDRFIAMVVAPALRMPRGEPRVVRMFDGWLTFLQDAELPGGCVILGAATELDDQPGPARDRLVSSQRDWIETLEHAIRIAVREGHFRADLDHQQFAFEMYGVIQASHFRGRLMDAKDAHTRARTAFERLLRDARATASQ